MIGVYSYRVNEPLRVYTVEINRAGSATSGAATYISSGSLPTGREGSTFPFLFNRSGDASAALTVDVDLWRYDGDLIDVVPEIDPVTIQERVQVVFPAGYSSVILNRNTTNDLIDEGNYYLGVTVVERSEYQVSTNGGYASSNVWDDDYNKPTLASLSLKDRNDAAVSFGAFDPGRTSYTASVTSETDFVTVEPVKASGSDAQIDILPSDARPGITGHQVDLLHGDNLIAIVVRTPLWDPASPFGTYQVEINRAGSSIGTAPSTVSIYGLSTGREGDTLPFLLTRNGDTSHGLTVPVNVTESGGDMVSETSRGSSDVVFRAGDAWAKIEVPTNADQEWEEHSIVTASVVDEAGYDVSSGSGSSSSKVIDNDVPDVTASFSVDSSRVQEGQTVRISITVKTDGAKEPHSYIGTLRFIFEPGTAQVEDVTLGDNTSHSASWIVRREFLSLGINQVNMLPVMVDGVVEEYRYQRTWPIVIVDDERAEDTETFDIRVEWNPDHQSKNPLTMDQGITSRTITIPEHDETPGTPDPTNYITVEVADSGSAGSTYTVSWHDTRECASNREYGVGLQGNVDPDGFEYHALGSTAGGNTQLTVSEDEYPLTGQGLVQVSCTGWGGWMVGEVPLPVATENSVERPVPGTYSSQPALTSLTVSPGTLGPAFNSDGFLYSVLDVPHSDSQITLNATARSGYTISWDPSEDADSNTDGHQVNLAEGYNSIFVSVDHDQGINSFTYEIIVKRAAPTSQQAQENTAATGAPTISGVVQVGQTLTASTTSISDADGLTNTAYSYQWIANDGTSESDITDATASSYTQVDGDVGKTIKVRVSFADDASNDENLTSVATAAVAATTPGAPGAPSVSVSDTGKLDVSWAAPQISGGSAITGYRVQWKEAADSWDTPADVSEATVTGTSYTVTGLTDGDEYTFRVFAINTVGDSTASEEVSGTPRETTAPTVSSATVVDATLTLTFSEDLTETPLPAVTAFTVNVAGSQRGVESVVISDSTVTLTLASAVTSTDAVTVSYTAPSDASLTRLNDLSGNSVGSFNGQAVTNSTAAVQTPLTASAHGVPTSHDGQDAFTFELRFSENLEGFSYKTLRDHAFTVTGGAVAKARRLTQGSNIGWEITVTLDSDADVTVVLPVTIDCNATGAVCTADGGKLSNRLELTVSGPTSQQNSQQSQENTAASGAPTISGTVEVGETLTADTSGIADSEGLTNVSYRYQWVRNDGSTDSDIQDATGTSYSLVDADEGRTIKVKVSFTDDAGNEETLTSVATASVAARPNSPATGAPTISGTVEVGETLTADTSGIADSEGLTNVSYRYQWVRNDGSTDSDIQDATGTSYSLVDADEGRTIKVKVSFTDDAGNEETLTSAATASVAAAPIPLTVSVTTAAPANHDGSSEFTFDIEFSENLEGFSYKTLRDHVFTVTGGSVEKAQRKNKPSNISWRITIKPQGTGEVVVVLPATTDCDAQGAICTSDGRKLSHSLVFTVTGPSQ